VAAAHRIERACREAKNLMEGFIFFFFKNLKKNKKPCFADGVDRNSNMNRYRTRSQNPAERPYH
jgi:hypothetical protein